MTKVCQGAIRDYAVVHSPFLITRNIGGTDMSKPFARSFYTTKAWIKCRAAYIAHRRAVDGGMCEDCHERAGYIVHHKTELTPQNINDPDIALSFGNLKYVCHECHNSIKHNGRDGSVPRRSKVPGMVRYMFAPDGDVVVAPPVL